MWQTTKLSTVRACVCCHRRPVVRHLQRPTACVHVPFFAAMWLLCCRRVVDRSVGSVGHARHGTARHGTLGVVFAQFPEYLQIIGVKEICLMQLYYAIIYERAPGLALMTVLGRLTTIPLIIFLVFIVGAPLDLVGGIVLDIVFGSWTLVRPRRCTRPNIRGVAGGLY